MEEGRPVLGKSQIPDTGFNGDTRNKLWPKTQVINALDLELMNSFNDTLLSCCSDVYNSKIQFCFATFTMYNIQGT